MPSRPVKYISPTVANLSSEEMQPPASQTFLLRLKEAVDRTGHTQRALSVRMRRHESTVSKWIKGTAQPNLDDLALIAELTGVTVDWLLGLPDAPPPPDVVRGVPVKAVRRLIRSLAAVMEDATAVSALLPEEGEEAPPPERRTKRRG